MNMVRFLIRNLSGEWPRPSHGDAMRTGNGIHNGAHVPGGILIAAPKRSPYRDIESFFSFIDTYPIVRRAVHTIELLFTTGSKIIRDARNFFAACLASRQLRTVWRFEPSRTPDSIMRSGAQDQVTHSLRITNEPALCRGRLFLPQTGTNTPPNLPLAS